MHHTGFICFLNFTQDWCRNSYVVVLQQTLDAWGLSPDAFFLNKTVHVTGTVKTHTNRPHIRVEDPSQLSVVEGTAP